MDVPEKLVCANVIVLSLPGAKELPCSWRTMTLRRVGFRNKLALPPLAHIMPAWYKLWQKTIIAVGAPTYQRHSDGIFVVGERVCEYLIEVWLQGSVYEFALKYLVDASMYVQLIRAMYQLPARNFYFLTFEGLQDDSKAIVEQSTCCLPAVFHPVAKLTDISARQEDQWRDVVERTTPSCIKMSKQLSNMHGDYWTRCIGKT